MLRTRLFPMLALASLFSTPEAPAATRLVGSGSCTDPTLGVCRQFDKGSAPLQ